MATGEDTSPNLVQRTMTRRNVLGTAAGAAVLNAELMYSEGMLD